MPQLIRIAHSPDADDAFMHYAVIRGKVVAEGLRFAETLADIETLNQKAKEGIYEVTAVSLHAFAYLDERYALLNSGASLGDGYGPVVIARNPTTRADLAGATVATPGRLTSARLALQLWQPEARCVDTDFDAVMDAVREGKAAAGVIIHEGQLTFAEEGFVKVADLGEWWTAETGTPLPLGGNAIRRDLGEHLMQRIAAALEASIRYALEHREEALSHALAFGRGLDRSKGDRFVGMYVNEATLDYGERGRRGVDLFYRRAREAGLIPRVPRPDFVLG
ncbi:MAG: ABC transporter substrate-binding protein [Acidobacteriia bacterium]|nr:ABC transporter substrate-binding protein [Terriglobia bacterium]